MSGAAAGDHHEAPRPDFRRDAYSIKGVIDGFAKGLTVGPGKPARARKARHRQAALAKQLDAALFAEVTQLAPPDTDALYARCLISRDVFQERPVIGRHFVHRDPGHFRPSLCGCRTILMLRIR